MKELINIVNSKIQAVVDELKTQKQALEQKLKTVETEIEQKVEAASVCKKNVEEASNTISELENDINKLKTDLQELHDKFDSAGFTELLEAGNKEINGKIIENNTKIAEQQDLIKKYSEEAQSIKDELTALRDSRINLESELNNTVVALKYYSKKIDEMTITAIEHAEQLSDIVLVDEDNNDTVDVDVNKVIDGTIFDEIDKISSIDRELSEQELEDILNTKETESEIKREQEEVKEEELSKTQALDAAIKEASNLSEVNLQTNTSLEPEELKEAKIEDIPQEEVIPEPVVTEELEETPMEPVVPDEPVQEEQIETIDKIPTSVSVPLIDDETFESELLNNNEQPQDAVIEEQEIVSDVPDTVVNVPTNDVEANKIKEIGLDPTRFAETDLNIVENNLDVQNGKRILDVLENHFVDTTNIYNSPTILITMTPDTLDEELSLLEHGGCMSTTLNYIFKYLDKIDISKLREKVTGPTDCITKVLYDCLTEKQTYNISEILGLSPEATAVLESNLDAKEYNTMCAFPEVVKANYDTIVNLHVDDPVKCITEHPKRFINNPDIFDDILDKYDTPDLVRCINKNPAVIDKL